MPTNSFGAPFTRMKRRLIVVILCVLVIALGGMWYAMRTKTTEAPALTVSRRDITEVVSITGKTKPAESVDLAFEISGKATEVLVGVGTRVSAGATLARIDARGIESQITEAQANVDYQQAKLDELTRGARPEELTLEKSKTESARSAETDARHNLLDKIRDAYTKSDDGIRAKIDQFFSNPRTSPQVNFTVTDPGLKTAIERDRTVVESLLLRWKTELTELDTTDAEHAGEKAQTNLFTVKSFLDEVSLAVNALTPSSGLTQATIDGWKSDVSTARTNVSTAIANLTAAEEKFRTATANVLIAEQQLTLTQAGSSKEEIDAARALLAETKAKLQTLAVERDKTTLRSPLAGIVTKQNVKRGEIVSANTPVVSVISEAIAEIEANIPEVDIGKMAVGNPVAIVLDAFPGETLQGTTAYVDPAETVIDGVVNFKVTIMFNTPDRRLKSGLTANLDIETERHTAVLAIPQFAVIENDNGTFARKLFPDGTTKDIPITVGARSPDGFVEIQSGLSEGDRIANIGYKGNGE